jgi:hypothetical protein
VPEKLAGKRARCARCGYMFEIPAVAGESAPPPASSAAAPRPMTQTGSAGASPKSAARPAPAPKPSPPPAQEDDGLFALADGDAYPAPPAAAAAAAPPVVLNLAGPQPTEAQIAVAAGHVVTAPTRSFRADALHSFVVPFKGGGIFILVFMLVAQLFLRLLSIFPSIGFSTPILILFLRAVIIGWICSVFLNTISETCRGEDELPSMSLADGIWEETILPFLQFFGSFLWVFLPGLILLALGAIKAANSGDVADVFLGIPWAFMVFFLLGVFIWPMTILTIAIHGLTMNALRYDLQLISIGRAFVPYLAIFGMLTVTLGLGVGSLLAATGILPDLGALEDVVHSFVGSIAILFVVAYMMLVSMRIIGLFYRHFKQRFAWQAE